MAKSIQQTTARGYWADQISTAERDTSKFRTSGERVIDRYRVEKADGGPDTAEDKYNMLYASTETIRPSLYSQTPTVVVQQRHKDRRNPIVLLTCNLLESCLRYAMEEVDFDGAMKNAVEDYTLPGMGQVWVRYVPTFKNATDEAGNEIAGQDGKPVQIIDFEALGLDYINWKDFLWGKCRVWAEVPWVAKRVYFDKDAATERFGADKANKMSFTNTKVDRDGQLGDSKQAVVWEIWQKSSRKVFWYSPGYDEDLLDKQDDPLRLKGFWPCPEPLRAIHTTRTLTPRPLYSQYQNQQQEMDRLTLRIRLITEALQARGVYDASQTAIAELLSPKGGNKMIPVQDWASFLQGGGMKGAVDFIPVQEYAAVLMQLYEARDRVKSEIYEITGLSDIVRGASKASETLGAQQIKQDWASARLKNMQKDVQRFVRDTLRLLAEIISEHFTTDTLGVYAGFDAPDDQQQAASYMAAFDKCVQMLKIEKQRCALVSIETDSTILANESGERQDRIAFLGQLGAFLQQAGPMAMQFPDMRGLLGSLMMFAVRTFPSSRPVEEAFEQFQDTLSKQPASDPNAKGAEDKKAQMQLTMQTTQLTVQQAEQDSQRKDATNRMELQMKYQFEQQREQNRTGEAQLELQVKQQELAIKRMELEIKQVELGIVQREAATGEAVARHTAGLAAVDQQHQHQQDAIGGAREDRAFVADRQDAAAAQQAAQEAAQQPGANAP